MIIKERIDMMCANKYVQLGFKLGLLFALMAFSSSCNKDYASFNTDPYRPTLDQLEADNFITGRNFPIMIDAVIPAGDIGSGTDFVNSYQISNNLSADMFSGFMGAAGDWGGNTNNLTYGFNLDWVNEQFLLTGRLMASWNAIKSATDINNDSLQFSVAQIIKITGISRATDMYGPIPYSSISTGTFTPRYDAQDSIYYSFFPELDRAISTLFTLGAQAGRPLARYDKIYGGDYSRWARFGNSLKLRLAMRMAYVDPDRAKQYAEEAASHPAGLLSTTADNALQGAVAIAFPYKNPLRTLSVVYQETRMGASMQSILSGYQDPRIRNYFNLSNIPGLNNQYIGVRSGINVTRSLYEPFSTLNVEDATPYPWMLASEIYFLLAEGSIRGWNMGGTAQTFYEAGIRASFQETAVAMPADYLNNTTSRPQNYVDPANAGNNTNALSTITIAWSESSNFEEKLERIITQKWIALYPNGQEAWSEFRRTGYPRIFPIVLNRSNGTVPTNLQVRRLPYPRLQYQENGAQVTRGLTLLGGPDNGATKVWWDKK